MKITILGAGYVGLSAAVVFAKQNEVRILDINETRIAGINDRTLLKKIPEIQKHLNVDQMDIKAYKHNRDALAGTELLVICLPTNYDPETNELDTSLVEDAIQEAAEVCPDTDVLIKSTIPIGFCDRIKRKYPDVHLFFSPEFLREDHEIQDVLFPSRIILGADMEKEKERAEDLLQVLKETVNAENVPMLIMSCREAESVKLFSNSYLAMRIAFFNEMDSFLEASGMDAGAVLKGVSLDPRIGDFYNNPSFGYGGYCLPKDVKQLSASFGTVPNEIISSITRSNQSRKKWIVKQILKEAQKRSSDPVIGFYLLSAKQGSNNLREAAVLDLIKDLIKEKVTIRIYEPQIRLPKELEYLQTYLTEDKKKFFQTSTLIVANRMDDDLLPFREKVYTRDLFRVD